MEMAATPPSDRRLSGGPHVFGRPPSFAGNLPAFGGLVPNIPGARAPSPYESRDPNNDLFGVGPYAYTTGGNIMGIGLDEPYAPRRVPTSFTDNAFMADYEEDEDHSRPEQLTLPPEDEYTLFDELKAAANAWALYRGYALVKARSTTKRGL